MSSHFGFYGGDNVGITLVYAVVVAVCSHSSDFFSSLTSPAEAESSSSLPFLADQSSPRRGKPDGGGLSSSFFNRS